MLAYAIRRLLATIPVMAIVAIIVFSLLYLTPGDPAAVLAGEQASAEDIARLRLALGLDDPFHIRFGHWILDVLQGDLGMSVFSNMPVMDLVVQRLEPTVSLTLASLAIAAGAGLCADRLWSGAVGAAFAVAGLVAGHC